MENKRTSRRALLGTAASAGVMLVAGSVLGQTEVRATGGEQAIVVDDITAMKSLSSPEDGQLVRTRGYYASGDGGGAWYFITSTAGYTGSPDGYVDHGLIASGKVAVLEISQGIDMLQVGVRTGVDCTARVRAAYAKGAKNYFYTGDIAPVIDCDDPAYPTTKFNGGIRPPSDSTHWFDGRFRFQAKASPYGEHVLFNLQGCEHVTMWRPWVIGDIGTHTGTGGEWGFGFYIASGSKHIAIHNGTAEKFWGDGYYIGVYPHNSALPIPEHILLQDCIADSNRRQGLSIVTVQSGRIVGGDYRNTGKIILTNPAFGIDIEPNSQFGNKIDVSLIDVKTSNNGRGGLQLVPGFLTASSTVNPLFDVYIANYRSESDGPVGGLRFAFPGLSGGVNVTKKIRGSIVIEKAMIVRPARKAVEWARWGPNAPEVIATDVTVQDPNEAGVTGSSYPQERSAFSIDIVASHVTSGQVRIGKITLIRPRAIDTRSTPQMLVPFWANAASGASINGLHIIDPYSENDLDGDRGFLRLNVSDDSRLTYTGPRPRYVLDDDLTLSGGLFAGIELMLPAAETGTKDVQLPVSTVSIGLEYEFVNASQSGGKIRLVASGSDVLQLPGAVGATSLLIEPGMVCKIRAQLPGVWSI